MMKKVLGILMTAVLVFALVACNETPKESKDDSKPDSNVSSQAPKELSGTLEIAGSTSVAPLGQDLADAFMVLHDKVTVNVQSLGSSAGVKAPYDGAAQIGMSSRNLKQEEKDWGVVEYVVAIDGIAVAIHPDNTAVAGITLEQLKKIYTGEITNWNEVGGEDDAIIVVSREEGSGTRGAFEEIVDYAGELRADALIGDGNGNVKANLITNKSAIAYLSLGFIDEQTKVIEIEGYLGTVENIVAGDYPVSRPFILITYGDEDELTKAFMEFALSDAGQEIAAETYIAVK